MCSYISCFSSSLEELFFTSCNSSQSPLSFCTELCLKLTDLQHWLWAQFKMQCILGMVFTVFKISLFRRDPKSITGQKKNWNSTLHASHVCTLQVRFLWSPFPIVSVVVWVTVFTRFDRCLDHCLDPLSLPLLRNLSLNEAIAQTVNVEMKNKLKHVSSSCKLQCFYKDCLINESTDSYWRWPTL